MPMDVAKAIAIRAQPIEGFALPSVTQITQITLEFPLR